MPQGWRGRRQHRRCCCRRPQGKSRGIESIQGERWWMPEFLKHTAASGKSKPSYVALLRGATNECLVSPVLPSSAYFDTAGIVCIGLHRWERQPPHEMGHISQQWLGSIRASN
eukprot:scaffold600498_cov19-Prasinocladus_malaysianus.AAC.1